MTNAPTSTTTTLTSVPTIATMTSAPTSTTTTLTSAPTIATMTSAPTSTTTSLTSAPTITTMTSAPTTTTIPGDILESFLSHIPTIDLISASSVSTTWHRAVSSSLHWSPRRRHPWLILHNHHHYPPSTTTHAFDPHTHSWHRIPLNPPAPPPHSLLPRSSTSTPLLFHLTPNHLSFSTDPFHRTWVEPSSPPSVWRRDPVVVSVGPYLVVAGGVCEFEDDRLAVEVLDVGNGRWKNSQSMPEEFQCSASAMWLSTTVADDKVYILVKTTGLFSYFDPVAGKWGEIDHVSPNSKFSLFAVAGAGTELVAAGLAGDVAAATGLWLWKVNCKTMERTELGTMPPEMVARLVKNGNGTIISSLEIRTAATAEAVEFVYVYNGSDPQEIFFCETKDGGCVWGSVRNPVVGHRSPMDSLVFTCSLVELDVLREVLMPPLVAGQRR